MLATCDSNLDETPQVVAANFGSGDDRFVIGWHSVRDGSGANQVQAAIQATRYDDEKPEVIGGATVPGEETILYTATSNFITDAVAVEQIGGTGDNQRLPEYDGSDSEASVHMTGALARTGEQLTMDVTQGNDGNGHSTAAITLRNNCLQPQTIAELVATLLDAAEAVLETKKTSIGGAISGETFRAETVTFSRLGTRVVVRAAVPGNDLLTFEGLAVGLDDFTANGTNYTYTLQKDSGATSTLVTAVSGNGEPVSINGQALSTGSSATVAIPNSGTGDIVVGIGAKTYTLTILRNSGTGGNGGGGGSGYSYYTIKATAGSGGSISPSGSISVREGRDQTFTITPDKGYAVANVKIDGKSIGAVKSYTFKNVRRTHTIEVIFVKGTASASTGDSSNLPLWSALLPASTLTLAGAVHYKRKHVR